MEMRPLSISSISSAASSGSNSSNTSSTSSGIQSSLTRNGSLNYGYEYRRQAYLASIESLNSSRAGSNNEATREIEAELKNLKLSPSIQLKNAAARAAVLAAGAQIRGFNTPGNRTTGFNRSFHTSLRYDKNTANRIQKSMANARDLMNISQSGNGGDSPTTNSIISSGIGSSSSSSSTTSANNDDSNQQRKGGSVSRNNSSTSSDSGHQRLTSFKSFKNSNNIICQCDSNPSITTTSSSSYQVEQTSISCSSSSGNTNNNNNNINTNTDIIDNSGKESSSLQDSIMSTPKAATLDGAQLCQRGVIHHHPDCSYARLKPRRASAKLQPSPSSASSNSNTSSLFRDDGFEDDLTSTASERTSSYHQHRRLSFQGRDQSTMHKYRSNHRMGDDDEDEEYQSCEEDFSHSRTTASTSSNIDDCALSTTSSSLMQAEQQVLDKISLANAKQQYRKSLLLEHQQKQYLLNSQNRIQALVALPPTKNNRFSISQSSNSNGSSNPSCTPPKQTKCDDRTVNIIGHMPTRSPGYWDSNLSITQRVVTEIIETERTYVEDLEQIVTGYICYLRNILKQHKRQQSQSLDMKLKPSLQQQQQQSESQQTMVTGSGLDEDDKSMFTFDDDTTSATNEVEEYEADETENDIATKENLSHVSEKKGSSNAKSENDNNAIISAAHIKKLFSNLEDIYKFNKDLLFRLEECYLNPSSVAECFVENSAGFEVYTHYCTMYPQVVSTLTELMSNQTSAQLLRERQNELNQGLPLGAYLLKPVQRILKYHILFQSLIKHTSEDDSVSEKDRQLINEAFSVMTGIACHINVMKRRHEHAIRVQEIQGLLSDWEGPDLTTFGELIMEDTFKLFSRPKSARHIFLFDKVLLITKKKRDRSLCYKGHILCSNMMLIENLEGQPLVFETVPFDNPKALCAFQAKTLDKKRDWCLNIKDMIIKSFEDKIPVHVKDILMGLTNSSTTETSSSKSSVRAPNYLERKRSRQEKKSL